MSYAKSIEDDVSVVFIDASVSDVEYSSVFPVLLSVFLPKVKFVLIVVRSIVDDL